MLIHSGTMLPYASSWLIFVNLLKWNRLEGYRYLKEYLNPSANHGFSCGLWAYGGDIPLNILESAMSLETGALKYSFLEGWFPFPIKQSNTHVKLGQSAQVRHCPEYIKAGYHSVIFYFERIAHCPWHGHSLERCEKCTRILNVDFPSQQGMYRFANQCEHLRVVFGLVVPKELESNFYSEVVLWVTKLIEWTKKSVELIGRSAYEVIAVNAKSKLMDVSTAFDFLVQRIGPPGFAHKAGRKVSVLTLPRSKLSWMDLAHSKTRSKLERLQPQIGYNEMICYLKSIRRYIWSRYVRHHIKCYKRMKGISERQWYTLNAEAICPCVLSYLLVVSKHWHTTPFRLLNLKTRLNVGGFWKIQLNDRLRPRSEFEYRLTCILSDFYRHWDSLRNYHLAGAECILCLDRFTGRVWGYNPGVYQSGLIWGCMEFWDSHFFMEDPSLLIQIGQNLCRKHLNNPLIVNTDEVKTKFHVRIDNVLCALYNLESTQARTANLEI